VPEMAYFHKKLISKKCRDSLEFKYRLRKYVFSETLHVLHSTLLSHTLVISVSFCMPDANSSIMRIRW